MDFIKNKLIIIIGSVVFLLAVAYIIYSLSTSGLFTTPSTPESRVMTTEIYLDNLGSAARLEENVAIVSIFANDKTSAWDFSTEEDKKTRSDILGYMDIAAKWLDKQAGKYGKSVNMICADSPQSDLYFETSFIVDTKDTNTLEDEYHYDQCRYIDTTIPSNEITRKYNCNSIVYLFFLNPENEVDYSAFAIQYYATERKYPYEMCFIPTKFCEKVVSPSVIIHEMLHCFGAPDLYISDIGGINYNTTADFVAYCQENIPYDIMFTAFSYVDGGKQQTFDCITNEITDITAYYIGWLDEPPPEVDEFGLVHNQYENYTG